MKEMKDDTMTQVQQLFSEYMKEVIMEMKGQLSGMVTEIVTTLVSPILQQNLIKTETRSRNRIGRDSNDNDISDDNGEEEYSEKIDNSNASGDEGIPTTTTRQKISNKTKVYKTKLYQKAISRQGKNSK